MSASHILSQASLQSLGCKLWLPLNGDTKDYSGNGNHGVQHGCSLEKLNNGRTSYHFNGGTTDYVSMPYTVFHGLGDFTYMALLNTNEVSTANWIPLLSLANSGHDNEIIFGHTGSSVTFVRTTYGLRKSGVNLDTDTWYHLALRRSGSTWTILLDGVEIYSTDVDSTALHVDANGAIIGLEQDSVEGGFDANQSINGEVAHAMVFDNAVSTDTISKIANTVRLIPDK